jgi:type III secretion protein J
MIKGFNRGNASLINILLGKGMGRLIVITLLLQLTACKEPLFTKLKEEHANEMMSILLRGGVDTDRDVDKKDQTHTLLVSKSDMPVALSMLKDQGYPKEAYKKIIDVFSKEGLISSPLEERVRYIYALTQEVQETLSQIDGVITARVHIVLPKNDPFGDNIAPSSASIFIKYFSGSNLEDIRSDIKFIVEKSIEGLKYEKISIVMLPAMESVNAKNKMQWNNILGIRVPQNSVGSLQLVLGVLVFLLFVTLLAVIFLLKRLGDVSKLNASDDDSLLDGSDLVSGSADTGLMGWNKKLMQGMPTKPNKGK